MLKSSNVIIMALALVGCSLLGCGKKGCTDSDSISYNQDAKKDNGTCRFEGSLVFWMKDSTAQEMLDDGITSLVLYINDDVVGTFDLNNQSYTKAPDCGASQALTITEDLFDVKIGTVSYEVFDNSNNKRWQGAASLTANTCENFELVYFP